MKKAGVFLAIISITIAIFNYVQYMNRSKTYKPIPTDKDELFQMVEQLGELSLQASSDTVGDTERDFLNNEIEELNNEIKKLSSTGETSQNNFPPLTTLWIKLGFSILFGGSALYVVLSQKYNEETQKWAFSVLTLISGVWIGSVS